VSRRTRPWRVIVQGGQSSAQVLGLGERLLRALLDPFAYLVDRRHERAQRNPWIAAADSVGPGVCWVGRVIPLPGVVDAPLEELPRFIAPMLASPGSAPTEAGWAGGE
jgi:hypothetical protein